MKDTLFDDLVNDPVWNWCPHNESRALWVALNKDYLRRRLLEARSCLIREYRLLPYRFDFENRCLWIGGNHRLQWQTRQYPDLPTSYENQQTNTGTCILYLEERS